MRRITFGLFILALTATPAYAQQPLASVRIEARVRIPDFLQLKQGQTTDYVRPDGTHVRRFTVYVTANRSWNLQVVRGGAVLDVVTGGSGNAKAITVDVAWNGDAPPEVDSIDYSLTAG